MRKQWTEAMVAEQIMEIHKTLGVMPSVSHLRAIGRNDLSNQICRSGGFVGWAKRLGIERLHSDSDTGWDGEKMLSETLCSLGFVCERQERIQWPFDLLVNKLLRVDVKSARFAEYGPCRGWFYRIGKAPQADVIALMQLDTGDCYFIPWSLVPTSNITISRDGGKWAGFKNRYDILTEMAEVRRIETEKAALIIQ